MSYYRIRQTDYDGHFTDSHVVAVVCATQSTDQNVFVVYPNPATEELTIEFPGKKEQLTVEILDLSGRSVWRGVVNGKQRVSVSHLPPGTYVIRIDQDGISNQGQVKKFVKH